MGFQFYSGVKVGRNVSSCNKYIKTTGVSACATREPSVTLITSAGIPRVWTGPDVAAAHLHVWVPPKVNHVCLISAAVCFCTPR